MAIYYFGKGNKQVKSNFPDMPSKLIMDGGWYVMVEPHPRVTGHTFEAQSDGTWLDVTSQAEASDQSDKDLSRLKYDTIMSVLEDLPVPPAITFMIMFHEINEYNQHGTVGKLLLNVVQTSGRSPAQVLGYLEPLMEDLSIAMGKLIGRRI